MEKETFIPGDYSLLQSMNETQEHLSEELKNILSHHEATKVEEINDAYDKARYMEILRNHIRVNVFINKYKGLFEDWNKFYDQNIA